MPAHERAGARAVTFFFSKNRRLARKAGNAGGQKGRRGLGEGIFARPPRLGWESVSAIPASAGRQNRKIFVSLIEKNFGGMQLRNVKKIFLFCFRLWRRRKRLVGFNPQNPLDFAQNGFGFRLTNTTLDDLPFLRPSLRSRFRPSLRRADLRGNQRAF